MLPYVDRWNQVHTELVVPAKGIGRATLRTSTIVPGQLAPREKGHFHRLASLSHGSPHRRRVPTFICALVVRDDVSA